MFILKLRKPWKNFSWIFRKTNILFHTKKNTLSFSVMYIHGVIRFRIGQFRKIFYNTWRAKKYTKEKVNFT